MDQRLKTIEKLFEVLTGINKKVMGIMGVSGFSKNQPRILLLIKEYPGLPMKFYGEKMNMNKSNFSNEIDRLMITGYVKRVHCEEDRRQIRLELTKEGSLFLEEVKQKINQHFLETVSHLDAQDMEMLDKCLDDLRQIFNKIQLKEDNHD